MLYFTVMQTYMGKAFQTKASLLTCFLGLRKGLIHCNCPALSELLISPLLFNHHHFHSCLFLEKTVYLCPSVYLSIHLSIFLSIFHPLSEYHLLDDLQKQKFKTIQSLLPESTFLTRCSSILFYLYMFLVNKEPDLSRAKQILSLGYSWIRTKIRRLDLLDGWMSKVVKFRYAQ